MKARPRLDGRLANTNIFNMLSKAIEGPRSQTRGPAFGRGRLEDSMNSTSKCTRVAAALVAAAACVKAAGAAPLANCPIGQQAGASIVLAQAEQAEPALFHGIGVVTAIDPATGSLTLDHEEIKGLMPAMEMMYRVDPRSLSEGLRAGDKVDFAVEAKTYTIRGVKLIERAK
jgi:Cu/Ag efflux protein CusF